MNRLREIIDNLRSCLKWPEELPTTRSSIQKNQREVFGCVSRTLIRSKQLFDVWLKHIQSNTERHKPIDLVLLMMMMTINDEKSVAIENIVSSIYFDFILFTLKMVFLFRNRFVASSRQILLMLSYLKKQCEYCQLFYWNIQKSCLNSSIVSCETRIQ